MPRDPAGSAIEVFRQATTCASQLRDANWAAVQARVAAGAHDVGGADVDDDPRVDPPLHRGRSATRTWVVVGVALAAAAAAVWWGARGWSDASVLARRHGVEQAIDATRPVAVAGRAQPTPATPPSSHGEASTQAPARSPSVDPQRPAAPTTAAPVDAAPMVPPSRDAPADEPADGPADGPADDPLEREAQLIASGRAALGRGALDDAALAIERHGREFPHGSMAPERMALAVRLQCARRDPAAARTAAAAFLRAHADSSLARRLAASPCVGDENP